MELCPLSVSECELLVIDVDTSFYLVKLAQAEAGTLLHPPATTPTPPPAPNAGVICYHLMAALCNCPSSSKVRGQAFKRELLH